jgi:hypothetical protein
MKVRRQIARVRGLGFIAWHSRHEFYHVLLGLVWAWFLRELWNEFNPRWVALSVFGALLPDADHLLYFFTYGKRENYTSQIKTFLRARQWRNLTVFIENGHKHNTNLSLHNYYFMVFLFVMAMISFIFSWKASVILFGSMLTHYLFDIFDDIVQLGAVNKNWRRWGRMKSR